MGVGFETYDAGGRLQATSEAMSFFVRKTGTGTTENKPFYAGNTIISTATVPGLSGYVNPLVCVVMNSGYAAAYVGTVWGTDEWRFATDAPIGTGFTYYIFDRSSTIPASNFGIELYDANGNMTFSSNQRVMRCVGIIGYSHSGSGNPWPNSYTASGRTLGVINNVFGGHSFIYGLNCYPIQVQEPENCDQWQARVDGKMYGVTGGGSTVSFTEITFDDVSFHTVNSTPPEDNPWELPAVGMVVDLTGIPVPQTFY